MTLDFLPEGSPDCPLLRLYDFDAPQARELYTLITRLADGTQTKATLPEALATKAENGCTLSLQMSQVDQGIVQDEFSGTAFVCRLSPSSWQTVAALISPFCADSAPGHYQWLDETSAISWLLSPDGSW